MLGNIIGLFRPSIYCKMTDIFPIEGSFPEENRDALLVLRQDQLLVAKGNTVGFDPWPKASKNDSGGTDIPVWMQTGTNNPAPITGQVGLGTTTKSCGDVFSTILCTRLEHYALKSDRPSSNGMVAAEHNSTG